MPTLFEPEPVRTPPDENQFGAEVYQRVREALFALPTYFRSDTAIEGILATDIFTLNAAFGSTIEDQVVSTLNQMREVWDPYSYPLCLDSYERRLRCKGYPIRLRFNA